MGLSCWFYRLSRWVLGGIFIFAGTVKLMTPEGFALLIDAYGIVPEVLLLPLAIGLPTLEVVAGIGLILDIKGSLAAITGLLVMFVFILCYGIWMGLDVDCGCFGPDDPEAEAFHGLRATLYRDLIMLAGVFSIYIWRRYNAFKPKNMFTLIQKGRERRREEDAYV